MPVGMSAYVPLANITLGGATNSVTFSSISQAYRDLVFVMQARSGSAGSSQVYARINGVASGNWYAFQQAQGSSNVGVQSSALNQCFLTGNASSLRADSEWIATANVNDYSVAGKTKTILTRGTNPTQHVQLTLSMIDKTEAVTQVQIFCDTSFAAGSTFALYGVAA